MDSLTRAALERLIQYRIDRQNFGKPLTVKPSLNDLRRLHDHGIKLDGDNVTEDGRYVFQIVHRYTASDGSIPRRELRPRLVPFPGGQRRRA